MVQGFPVFLALRVGLGFPAGLGSPVLQAVLLEASAVRVGLREEVLLSAVLLSAGLLEFLAAAVLLPAGLPADRVGLREEALLPAVLLVLPVWGLFRRRL